MLCLGALFYLQYPVLDSPRVPTGSYVHPVNFKGGTFYLTDSLFRVWNALNTASIPPLITVASLGGAYNTFEYRIKRRLWNAEMDKVVERVDNAGSA